MDDAYVAAVFEAAEEAGPQAALEIADSFIAEHPDHHAPHFLMAQTAMRVGLPGLSAALYRKVSDLAPDRSEPWNNLSKTAQTFQKYDEAANHLSRALALDPASAQSIYNLATVRLQQGRPEEALDLCERARALSPDLDPLIRETSALGHLALGNWRQGWDDYEAALDGDYRLRKTYHGNIEAWTGPERPNHVESFASAPELLPLIVHTEQGIGDEIIFASMLNDLEPVAQRTKVILDCDPRNAGLFKRSFPHLEVHGTRKDIEPPWLEGRRYAVSAIASLGKFYRLSDEAFPGSPYLKACPMRAYQWKSLFRSGGQRRPVIGIAWTGGRKTTGQALKSASLDDFAPLFAAMPHAIFVSLEYRERSAEIAAAAECYGVDLFDAPWATLSGDYDDTAGLVAACDFVVSVMTSVAHLASALGVRTHMMLPTKPQPVWRYYRRERHPVWYRAMTLHRQTVAGDWSAPLSEIIGELRA